MSLTELKSSILKNISRLILAIFVISAFSTIGMAESPLRFITVGDLHLDTKLPNDRLDKIIYIINNSDADFVVFLGDEVSNSTDIQAWKLLKIKLATINKPYFIVAGNHDVETSSCASSITPNPIIDQECNFHIYTGKYPEQFYKFTNKFGRSYQIIIPGISATTNQLNMKWYFDFNNPQINKSDRTLIFDHGPIQYIPGGPGPGGIGGYAMAYPYDIRTELAKFSKILGGYAGHNHSFANGFVNGVRYVIEANIAGSGNYTNYIGYTRIRDNDYNDYARIRYQNDDGSQAQFFNPFPNIIDYYPESNVDSYGGLYVKHRTKAGQSFKMGSNDAILNKARFFLKRQGNPTGKVYAKIYASTGTPGIDGKGTGYALAISSPIDVSTIPTSPILMEFNFPTPFTLKANNNYVIAIDYTGGDSSNFISYGRDASSPTHPGNFCWFDDVIQKWGYGKEDMIFYLITSGTTSVVPNKPNSVATSVISDNTISISWVPSSGPSADYYTVAAMWGTNYATTEQKVVINAPSTSTTMTLSGGKKYILIVNACNNTGCSAWTVSPILDLTGAPQMPISVTASIISGKTISISWIPATMGGPAISYTVAAMWGTNYATTEQKVVINAPTTSTTMTLVGGRNYILIANACNNFGCSEWQASPILSL